MVQFYGSQSQHYKGTALYIILCTFYLMYVTIECIDKSWVINVEQNSFLVCLFRFYIKQIKEMSRDMTKLTKWVKTQISLGIRPVWSVFAVRMKKAWVLSYPLSAQWRLIRLGGCPGWSEPLLGAHSLCWFCHVVAQSICTIKNLKILDTEKIAILILMCCFWLLKRIFQGLLYPGIYAEGYIVFVFLFICLYVCSFIHPSCSWNLRQSFFFFKVSQMGISHQPLIRKHPY